ncbi:MAG: cobalt ECF transporter T component CbiQ [Nitrospirae bacterium CG_4_10_14_3_um_filter_44_29]|nr:MAG: cobalt ECF transporter T component CbiQ [Nitrospirae bacterium CG01_land_8_20_14_3_00_44_22]PIX89123.1 MAG: cobalt ECF transporter T component CbiQ [Nitrospirae bacterium CG_4_10_14_3_um_filter_44_29]
MKSKVPSFLLERHPSDSFNRGKGGLKMPFIEKGIHHVADVIKTGYVQWETASKDDFFQKIDARIKVLSLLFYIIIVSLKKDILPEVLVGVFVFILTMIARLNILSLYKRVLFFSFIFGFLIALPSAFNVITKGEIIFPILHLSKTYRFWIYHIPSEIGITREGIDGVMMLTSRVMNSLSLSFFVLYTTPFPEIIKALKVLKVPDGFLIIVTLSYKYIFIFAKTVEDMHLAKKSRSAGQVSDAEARSWIAGRVAFMFKKTRLRCEEIFKAMLGRGFSDNIKIYGVSKLHARDWFTGAIFFLVGVIFLWM